MCIRDSFRGRDILPMEGESLFPVFIGNSLGRKKPIIYEFAGNRFIKDKDWKLVAQVGEGWELYNLRLDRTELNNLIDKYPERAKKMKKNYEDWAKRVGAMSNEEARRMPLNSRAHYTFEDK